jgi:hypothetical protein
MMYSRTEKKGILKTLYFWLCEIHKSMDLKVNSIDFETSNIYQNLSFLCSL